MEKLVVPKFATEAEEPIGGTRTLDVVEANFVEATESGQVRRAIGHGARPPGDASSQTGACLQGGS